MPIAIYMFALTAFALGLAEFVPIGLSDIMAGDLGVRVQSVGAVVSAYALGATISAPILSALTAAWPRKQVMLATALVFSLGSLMAALANDLTLIVLSRFVAGVGHGLFLAVASSVAARLVGGQRAGSAVAMVFSGFTIALAIGVPVSTYLGGLISWRPLFLVITAFGVLGLIGLAMGMKSDPADRAQGRTSGAATAAALKGLKALLHPRLISGVLVTVLAYIGSFTVFTYIAPLLTDVTGVSVSTISIFMLIYGVLAAVGNTIGGAFTDRLGPDRASLIILIGIAVVGLGIFVFAQSVIAMGVLVAILGLLTFGAVPPLQARLLALAERYTPDSVGVAAGLNIAGFNSGIVFGSAIGGLTVASLGVASTALVAAVSAVLGVILLLVQMRR